MEIVTIQRLLGYRLRRGRPQLAAEAAHCPLQGADGVGTPGGAGPQGWDEKKGGGSRRNHRKIWKNVGFNT